MSAKCHVWTAPRWQGSSGREVLSWSVRPCVRPVYAARTAAGHDALREAGPDQKHAFQDALAQMGCPVSRLSTGLMHHRLVAPPNLWNTVTAGTVSSCRNKDRFAISFALGHDRPGHPRHLVGKCHGGKLGRPAGEK